MDKTSVRMQEKTQKKINIEKEKDLLPNPYQPLEDERISPFTTRIKKGSAILMIAAIVSLVILGMDSTGRSVDTSVEAEEAIETHMSATLVAGTRLMEKDDNYIGGDLTITHNSDSEETKIWVWDYAAEDGDYVQIIVNGVPLGDAFMIKNKPVSFVVPSTGEIQVLGIKDGGGGITYGVYYGLNQMTYFNGMREGGNNLYTLVADN